MATRGTSTVGYKALALMISLFLWTVAHGSSSIERGFDIPIVLRGLPPDLVITEQNADAVNVRVLGSRAALRNLAENKLEYPLEVTARKPGGVDYEVDLSSIELPRGMRVVSRSPTRISLSLEARGSKSVRIRPELEGEPAEGFEVGRVEVIPPRVRVSGARSEVLRLNEVVTDAIDVTGLSESVEREGRPLVAGKHVWLDDPGATQVRIEIVPKASATNTPRQGDAG